MNQIISIVSFAGLFLFSPQEPQYVVTRGTATVRVPTDFVKIAIGIRTTDESLEEANRKNKELVHKAFDVFRHLAIPDSDFTTTQSQIEDAYSAREGRKLEVRYQGTLTLRKISLYDSLLAQLVSLGDINIHIQSFGSNNIAAYAADAYQKAVSSARKQAELLLAGSNQHVGKIIKLLQDGRDPFTEYDDIDQLAHRITQAQPALAVESPNFFSVDYHTVRRPYFEQSASVTAIFEIK